MKPNREGYRPVTDLPDEKQSKIESLESQSDEIEGLRGQLAMFYRDYRKFLPTREVVEKSEFDPGIKRLRIPDLVQLKQDGQDIGELIPMDRVEEFVRSENDGEEGEDFEIEVEMAMIEIQAAIEGAIEIYQELKGEGGAFKENDPIITDSDAEEFYRMRWQELGKKGKEITELRATMDKYERMLDIAQSKPGVSSRPGNVDAIRRKYMEAVDAEHELVEESPEAYYHVFGQRMKEMKEVFDANGRIVETPYVLGKIDRVTSLIEKGRPVFIHGELGSGKTELARHMSRTRLSKPYISRWEKKNAPPRGDKDARKAWAKEREAAMEPLFVSGYKGIETEQLLAARTVKTKDALPPEEQVQIIEERWEQFRRDKLALLESNGVDGEEFGSREQQVDEMYPTFVAAYQEQFKSPLETKTVLGPVFEAMKEGRPVVIDEINAIPHHTLIVLNDILTRQVGETYSPPFPDVKPFEILDGFSCIVTGNYKPEDGLRYVGRQPLDAAFLSRFGIVSYDYLPMQRSLEPEGLSPEEQRNHRMENELLQMLVTRFANKDLSITLPEGGMDALERLAYIARVIQDIFSEKQVGKEWFAQVGKSKVAPNEVLKENVLSIRHLLHVVDQWVKDGFVRDLDDYLFQEYVDRSSARPNEKIYLYRILKLQGDFFADDTKWPAPSEDDEIMRLDINKRIHERDKFSGRSIKSKERESPIITTPPKAVIEKLFGPAPERTEVPSELFEKKAPASEGDNEVESTAEAMEKLRGLMGLVEMSQRINDESEGTVVL
jgi:MoxR-like ATPase